tara:strand:+ start:1200 stop:2024 length:825 start_codon:yes stop_codon:yes gene_type:complete
MLTPTDQYAVIESVAASTQGLGNFALIFLATFVAFLVLVLLGESIILTRKSIRISAIANNATTSKEDTMANANKQDSNDNKTEAPVEKVTMRDRAHNAVDFVFDTAEAVRDGIKSKWASFTGFLKNTRDAAVKKWQDRVERAEAARVKAEEDRIRKLREEVGYFDILSKMEEMDREMKRMQVDLQLALDPTQLPDPMHFKLSTEDSEVISVAEDMTLKLRETVEELLKEADALLETDRTSALQMLRTHPIAEKYSIPAKERYDRTRNAYLRLIA